MVRIRIPGLMPGRRPPAARRTPGGRLPRAVHDPLAGMNSTRLNRERDDRRARLPTLLAAAGDPDIKGKLLKGYDAAGKTFKVHLDGYN
jgi:hypothetical protein